MELDQWRLIDDSPANGGRNMAVDTAILEAVIDGEAPPTVRFYGWTPYCLSLGYGQHVREVDHDRLRVCGYTLVRRPTGGKAVLHANELTYSIALSALHPLAAGSISESYQRISRGLIAALELLGLGVAASPAEKLVGYCAPPICFEATSDYEIAFAGRKLVGSAQMRRRGALLQHGSLPLDGDLGLIGELLMYPDSEARARAVEAVRRHAITLSEALDGHVPDRAKLLSAFTRAIEVTFGVELLPGRLSESETARADQLETTVYGHDSWTFRR